IGPLPAHAGVGDVARHRDRVRYAAAEDQDALQLPTANESVGKSIRAAQHRLTLPERQFISEAEGETVGYLVFGRSLLECIHAAHGRGIRGPEALREGIRSKRPEPGRKTLLQFDLQSVIRRRDIRRDIAERAEPRELAPRLYSAGRGRRNI